MAHLSLYRKYRSQKFADVVGQTHITQTLQNAVGENRVAHAYLFSGPRGTGKTSVARILAKTINCEAGGLEPDNTCPSCLEIIEGTSLDVIEIDAASHGSVDDAREIRERVAYAPVRGKSKVYIYDECHMLSREANNALLKVLEEPPEHVIFIFATTEPHKVLQTLMDRCQRYEFRAISAGDIAEHLAVVCDAEAISVDEDALHLIATRAIGSMRDALSLLDQLTSFAGMKIQVDDVGRLLGSVPSDSLFELVDVLSERDVGSAFLFTDRLVRSGSDIREFVRALIDHLRNLFLIMHAPAAQEILEVSDDHLERMRAQANRFDPAEVLRLIDLAAQVGVELRQAVEPRFAFEVGLARMARPDLHAVPAGLLSRIERLERLAGLDPTSPDPAVPASSAQPIVDAAAGTPAPARPVQKAPDKASGARPQTSRPAPQTPATPARSETPPASSGPAPSIDPSSLDIDKITRAWPIVLEKVKRRKISFQALLIPARPVAWADGELVLAFDSRSRWHKDNVSDPVQHLHLVEAFEEVFGARPRIRCVLDDAPAPPKAAAVAAQTPPDDAGEEPAGGRSTIDLIRQALGEAEVVDE